MQVFLHIREYIRVQAEYYKLKAVEKAAALFASVISTALLIFLAAFCLLFLGFALSLYLGGLLNEPYMGFAATGGIYLILLVAGLLSGGKFLKRPLMDAMVRNFFKDDRER